MKTSIKTIAAAIALSAAIAGPASAMISKGDVNRAVQATLAAGSNISVITNNNGTVTLHGYFADSSAKHRAIQAAKNTAGVERVISHAFQSN